jgi:hypothetical protein
MTREGLNVRRFWNLEGLERNAEKAENFIKRLAAGGKGGTRR